MTQARLGLFSRAPPQPPRPSCPVRYPREFILGHGRLLELQTVGLLFGRYWIAVLTDLGLVRGPLALAVLLAWASWALHSRRGTSIMTPLHNRAAQPSL